MAILRIEENGAWKEILSIQGPKGDKGEPGTTNYNDLENKPKINGIELVGNKTSEELGLASKEFVKEFVKEYVNNIIK